MLPKIEDIRGNLTFFEVGSNFPFEIKRVHWIYDVPGDEERGGHALRHSHEVIVALSGSFDVEVFNGKDFDIFPLRRSYKALYVPNLCWRKLTNFSTNSLALIASSNFFDKTEYIYSIKELANDSEFKKKYGL